MVQGCGLSEIFCNLSDSESGALRFMYNITEVSIQLICSAFVDLRSRRHADRLPVEQAADEAGDRKIQKGLKIGKGTSRGRRPFLISSIFNNNGFFLPLLQGHFQFLYNIITL